VHQLQGERSYHIFYQLVRGADKRLREALRLPSKPDDFKYLAQSGCLVRGGRPGGGAAGARALQQQGLGACRAAGVRG
jgi:hypothetical protein